jgi:Sap, sulfolipid-1-addressing protein
VSVEAAVLGLLSAIRAVPLAILYALLRSPRPRRLITAYTAAGLVVSLVVGLAAVWWLDGSASTSEQAAGRYVVDLVIGVGALSYAAGFVSGRIGGRPRGAGPLDGGGLIGRLGARLRTPTVPLAAVAGAVTNLPGLFYLAGLVAILETQPSAVGGAVQVLIYNVLRFAAPLAALVLVIARPGSTATTVERVHEWGTRHQRELVGGVAGSVGVYLVVKGLAGLL